MGRGAPLPEHREAHRKHCLLRLRVVVVVVVRRQIMALREDLVVVVVRDLH